MIIQPADLAREALSKANAAVSRRALTSVRPIYRNLGPRPEHLGTVTFVEVDGQDFILTAAHVVDNHREHTLYIGHQTLQDLTLTFHTTVAPNGDRLRDRWDFSFAKADPVWRESGIVPLGISDLPVLEDGLILTAVGYPNSSNRRIDHKAGKIIPTQRRYTSQRLPPDHPLYQRASIAHETHVAISHNSKHAMMDGQKVRAFEPRGMSGGVFFGLPDVHKTRVILEGGEPSILPAGLIIERCGTHRALFGPMLTVIADQIRVATRASAD
ncbi:MAG: hypothetical protein V2I43_27700 [Parvularcula sp.]|nr:hypothetical protein [Parvularcula sp.]